MPTWTIPWPAMRAGAAAGIKTDQDMALEAIDRL
jgi:hypothetical protein